MLREKFGDITRTSHPIEMTGLCGDQLPAAGSLGAGRWESQTGSARLRSVDLAMATENALNDGDGGVPGCLDPRRA